MPVPLLVAAPAVAAALAYLNARTSFWYDYVLIKSAITGAARLFHRERNDRLNLFYMLEYHAQTPSLAAKTLLIFEGKEYSYAQVFDTALRYGTWLRTRHGVRPKDIVAIDFQNSDTFVFLWWALWSIGAKPAFINYNLTGPSLSHCLKAATTKLCIIDPLVSANVSDDVKAELPGVQFVDFTPDVESEAAATEPVRAPDADRSETTFASMAILIYTSGTTGLPKPAVVSWGKCIAGGNIASTLLNRGNGDIMYTSMPLYHSSASVLSFCATVLSGSTQALGRKFSTKTFWTEVRASKATSVQYVGETLRYLLAAPPEHDPVTGECLDKKHNVNVVFGNGLRPDIWNKFKDRFGIETIVEFYAATEGPFGTWNVSRNDLTAGAIGRNGWIYNAFLSMSVKLVEVDHATDLPWRDPKTGFCKLVKAGDPGEMIFKLPVEDIGRRFQGYYGNPAATSSKILRDVFSTGDAYFRTGDIIRWDADGRVFFSDRIGDTFRWKSENVSTAEVSEAVGRHPAVREANVYGVQLPHHDGRAGCAAVALADAPDADTLRSLAAHVRASLPRYAQPLFLRVTREVGGAAQTTGTQKQQKHKLREAGVRPGGDEKGMGALYWLSGDTYAPFGEADWRELDGGRVKL